MRIVIFTMEFAVFSKLSETRGVCGAEIVCPHDSVQSLQILGEDRHLTRHGTDSAGNAAPTKSVRKLTNRSTMIECPSKFLFGSGHTHCSKGDGVTPKSR